MDDVGPRLRLGLVPGVNPGRWVDTWRGRYRDVPLDLVPLDAAAAERALLDHDVDAAFLRLPLRSGELVRIPLWTEETVVAMSRESELTLLEALTPGDLTGETVIVPADDVLGWVDAPGEPFAGLRPPTTSDALDLVAHEAGVCVLPLAIARELHRRDVELRPLRAGRADDDEGPDDARPAVPVSQVGLAWLPEESGEPAPLVERLIGVVRGRSPSSTRGAGRDVAPGGAEPEQPARRKPRPAATARRSPGRSGRGASGRGRR